MANETPANKVDTSGDHDRVVMLSLKADGTPDQTNPEVIGDKDFAVEAAKEQFRQQAVSAVDQDKRGEVSDADLLKAHKSAEKSAEASAEKVINDLHKG